MRKINTYHVRFDSDARNDIKMYKKTKDFVSIKIIWELIDDIKVNGEMKSKGSPEKLRRDLKGYYSRRINDIDRLVYRIVGDTIEIASCREHYNVVGR